MNSFNSESNQIRDFDRKPLFTKSSSLTNDDNCSEDNEDNKIYGLSKNQTLGNYRDFVKLFLKIKFEKLDNEHSGQKINQDIIWQQACKAKVPSNMWKQFILNELKNYKKYNEMRKKK